MPRPEELTRDQAALRERAGHSLDQWLELIEGENRVAVQRFLDTGNNRVLVETAPASRGAHQAWPGGYAEHMRQTMFLASSLFDMYMATGVLESLPEEESFTLSDAIVVMFLHDIEKPFMYYFEEGDDEIKTTYKFSKEERKAFKTDIVEQYGFLLSPTMHNALLYVEGVRDVDYVPGERTDHPLAALCHAADNISARGLYAHTMPVRPARP